MSFHVLNQRSSVRYYVYFVRAANTGLIKIGLTGNPEGRLRDLRATCPVQLDELLVVRGTAAHEWALHLKFNNDRSHGEWFRETPQLFAFIEELRGLDE